VTRPDPDPDDHDHGSGEAHGPGRWRHDGPRGIGTHQGGTPAHSTFRIVIEAGLGVMGMRATLVVGAGSSGLAAAKNLRQAGVDVEVVEREPDLGGNWNIAGEQARVYASTA
jgi:NADPH-dependent 2,4-dienoyl-CoA reductase/sulfur reductase-like enzyme